MISEHNKPAISDHNKRGGTPLHTRAYEIEAYVEDETHFRLIGVLKDVRPDGLWGVDDPNPLTMHHMFIELVIDAQTLAITVVETKMLAHPQEQCPLILPVFQQLVGISIARGFSNKVKELFGGPRACTHFGALLNAMAPVAMQTLWAFFHSVTEPGVEEDAQARAAGMRAGLERNRDTCHVWATDGPMFTSIAAGEPRHMMLSMRRRLEELGVDPDEYEQRMQI